MIWHQITNKGWFAIKKNNQPTNQPTNLLMIIHISLDIIN